ncbi:MAG TPA: cytochrome C oxidase subunit II [Synechococcales bacterium UBA10510]|jgi:cytochrome c oxidase subunit 2|nr:cytochrome C oxidase subunit II [Synechococcales bacterium UBA10510]
MRRAAGLALATIALIATGIWIGFNVNLLPVVASANAPVYDDLFKLLFSIGIILFVGITIVLVYSLFKFRRRVGDQGDGLAIEGNLPLEIVWTAIPAVVVLFIGIYSYDIYERMGGMTSFHDHSAMLAGASDNASGIGAELASNIEVKAHPEIANTEQGKRYWAGIASMDDPDNKTLPVDVTAMQFAFIFHYPEGNITSGELHVSAGQPVQLRMEARDVIHAFWVPQFRLKQDIIPGQPTLLSFTPTKPGTYPIVCAELCGPYHGGMRTNVVVHDPDSFQTWLDQNRQPAISA